MNLNVFPLNIKELSQFIIFVLLLLNIECHSTPQKNKRDLAQENVENVIINNTIVDSIPKNRIMIEDPPPNIGNWIYVFYDKDGKVTKRVERFDLPANSKFKNLSFPRKNVQERPNGLIEYDLVNQSFARRKKILQEAGVTGVPDSVIQQATQINYFGSREELSDNGKFIISYSTTQFIGRMSKTHAYVWFDQTNITIYDFKGNPVWKYNINLNVDNIKISDDGRYLLMTFSSQRGHYDAPSFDVPMQVFDVYSNRFDSIDLTDIYHSNFPLSMKYGDGFFQILLEAGHDNIHLLIKPAEKLIYFKFYKEFKGGDDFKSMHLPDGKKIDIDSYTSKFY